MDRRVTPAKRVTSPFWGTPPPCKQALSSYTFYGGNVVLVLVRSLFFHCGSFSPWWPLAFFIFSPPLQNSHHFLPTKKCPPLFYSSRSSSLSLFFSRWASLTCRLLSPFLSLSLSLSLSFSITKSSIRLCLSDQIYVHTFPWKIHKDT